MADAAYEVRTVDRLLAANNHGDDGAEANRLYAQIMAELRRTIEEYGHPGIKIKASLAISIDFVADHQGAIDVAIGSKAKLPAKPVNKERFFLSRDDVLTLQDPARDSLFPGADLGRRRRALGRIQAGDPLRGPRRSGTGGQGNGAAAVLRRPLSLTGDA